MYGEPNVPARAFSDSTISGNYGDMTNGSVFSFRGWNTCGDFSLNSAQTHKEIRGKRHVKFDPCVRVVLIAGREEYIKARIHENLWYFEKDFSQFKSSAILELKSIMLLDNISSKEAMIKLYCPNLSELGDDSLAECSENKNSEKNNVNSDDSKLGKNSLIRSLENSNPEKRTDSKQNYNNSTVDTEIGMFNRILLKSNSITYFFMICYFSFVRVN